MAKERDYELLALRQSCIKQASENIGPHQWDPHEVISCADALLNYISKGAIPKKKIPPKRR